MTENQKTLSGNFFCCTVSLIRTQEDGSERRVKEQYVVPALTFAEAENNVLERATGTDIQVTDLAIAPFTNIITTDADRFYRVRINTIFVDEVSGREKKSPIVFLVQAASTKNAQRSLEWMLTGTIQDYAVESIIETKIIDILSE